MNVPSSEAAADALATALNAADLGVEFCRNRWPKYALKDLAHARADVVAEWPAELDPHDNAAGVATETRLAVLLQQAIEKTDVCLVDELTALLERIGRHLAATQVPGIGYPVGPLTIGRIDDMLDRGHFVGGIGVVYRVFREYEEDL